MGSQSTARRVRCVIIGAGNLGRRFASLITEKRRDLFDAYGLDLHIVGIADSRGAAVDANSLDGADVTRVKESGGSVGDLPRVGRPGMTGLDLLQTVEADVLCEASPVGIDAGGEPGLSHIRTALAMGMHVTTPNKGPIVLAYRELMDLAEAHGVQLRFDGTVAGGLPALYLGMRDLRGAVIERIESVPNLTTGYVLDLLAEGVSWDEASQRARSEGVLESDPTWDLDGWDAAAKLAILANAVLGQITDLQDIPRTGIREIDLDWLREQKASGHCVRLVASATRQEDGRCALNVAPATLSPDHPLGHLGAKQMGIVYQTDIFGTISAIIDEPTPVPSAATMLRDILDIYC